LKKIKKKEKFNFNEILEILTKLNNTFKIMVDNKMIHRDLKLENILLKKNENGQNIWKIVDYGVNKKLLALSEKYYTGLVGTIPYMAPEVLSGDKYNNKCDLWSLGIILYNLYFQEVPYKGDISVVILNKIRTSGKTLLKKSDSKSFNELFNQLLEAYPNERISWEIYFDHDFFKAKE